MHDYKPNVSRQVPELFRAAVKHDVADGTNFDRIMICRIQSIGNIASISDGKFKPTEQGAVKHYVSLLEEFIENSFAGKIEN